MQLSCKQVKYNYKTFSLPQAVDEEHSRVSDDEWCWNIPAFFVSASHENHYAIQTHQ
jgi:hypothetical protein